MSENTFTHNSINVNPLHKITIVAARWNAELVDDLVHAASEHLKKNWLQGYRNCLRSRILGISACLSKSSRKKRWGY